MEIGSAYSASGLWDLNALNGVDSSSQKSSSTGQSGSSGDTVDISDEARKLFSEKIHQYDKGSSTTTTADANQNSGGEETEASEAQGGGASGGSGGSSASGSDSTEAIKKQLESLQEPAYEPGFPIERRRGGCGRHQQDERPAIPDRGPGGPAQRRRAGLRPCGSIHALTGKLIKVTKKKQGIAGLVRCTLEMLVCGEQSRSLASFLARICRQILCRAVDAFHA